MEASHPPLGAGAPRSSSPEPGRPSVCLLGPRRCRCPMARKIPGTGIKPGLHVPSAGISHKPEAHLPSAPSHPWAAWHVSPALGPVPRRLAPPTTSTPREADVDLAALVETKVPFRKGVAGGRRLPSSSESSLQSGHGAAACGTQRSRSSLSAVRSPPGGPPPPHTASVCSESQREMKDSLAPCVLKRVHKGNVPP